MKPEELLRQGNVTEALSLLQQQVRENPADPRRRVFLFQLLAVLGQWDKALTQLNVAAELDPKNLLMAQVCRVALQAEAMRQDIFAGRRTPLIFGQPQQWVGMLLEANKLAGEGKHQASARLRQQAFDAAPASAGSIDGQPFEWLADADTRLGPMMEAVVEGKYYWVPICNIRMALIEKPADLRDLVWSPASFIWANGGQSAGLVPTRYPGSESSGDTAILMARKTDWVDSPAGAAEGLGQRMLATDAGEYPLLETRRIEIAPGEAAAAPAAEA
ncbi:MAG: type VI secretion system accessory protein TagJ [Phycisphaerae bacterium]